VGELAAARAELTRSVGLDPTVEALETLGTVDLKLGDFHSARKHLERGAKLGGDAPVELYSRAKVLRLAGDAARGTGDTAGAARRWRDALEIWTLLGETVELPPSLAGERFAEIGKLFWDLDRRDEALANFARATEADPDGSETHVQIISFLILRDEADRARDVFYDALGSDRVSEYHKVYLCLWILAEDRRAGRPDDRLATEYLAGRDGPLWYDDVARLATGRATVEALGVRATTRARRAELRYYGAVLGPPGRSADEIRRLLEDVVSTDMILFFEYDMARRYLGRAP
jgi:tetratricopeptide (TPR) repeat protein